MIRGSAGAAGAHPVSTIPAKNINDTSKVRIWRFTVFSSLEESRKSLGSKKLFLFCPGLHLLPVNLMGNIKSIDTRSLSHPYISQLTLF
jgi:hypothetical protein